MIPLIGTRQHSQGSVTVLPKKKSVIVCGKSFPILLVRKQFSFRNCLLFCFSSLSGGAKYLGPVWYVCLKIENCCLKIFVEIRVGEKVY